MNLVKTFKNILFEEEKKQKYVKGLKLFYIIDINIKEPEEVEKEIEKIPTQPPPAETPIPTSGAEVQPVVPQEDFKQKVNNILNEEEVSTKQEGILQVPESEVENIQTLEDLLDYIVDHGDEGGRQLIDDFTIEMVYAATGINNTALSEILKKDDKILIDLDYGTNKKDSIGIKVLKRSGVNNISVMIKKNGNIIPAKFNLQDFNNQIITYRNSIVGDVND